MTDPTEPTSNAVMLVAGDPEKASEPQPWLPPARMTPEAVAQLAMDLADGKLWTDRHAQGNGIEAFKIVFMLGRSAPPKEIVNTWGMLYEYLDKAGEYSVNGIPQFFSVQFMHIDDHPLLVKAYDAYQAAKAAIKSGASVTSPT
jgi:hypothetical protein